jgi:hypothetical protein
MWLKWSGWMVTIKAVIRATSDMASPRGLECIALHMTSLNALCVECNRATSRAMKRDAQITVRIPSALKAKLVAEAKAEDRSLAYVVERILREHFEKPRKGAT